MYTSASGHVLAGETIKQAFYREVLEEIGVDVNTENATMVEINIWKHDKIKNDKTFKDRAFANVYINEINSDYTKFDFDVSEVQGLVKLNAKQCLNLFTSENKLEQIDAIKITNMAQEKVKFKYSDFLIFENEIGTIKYGKVLQTIINLFPNN